MIKTENGKLSFNGNKSILLADYSVITEGMFNLLKDSMPEEIAKEQLQNAFDMAFMSDDELFEAAIEAIEETSESIVKDIIIKALKGE